MTERKRAVLVRSLGFIFLNHMRFRNLHAEQYDKYDGKDTHSQEQCWVSVTDLSLGSVTDQITNQYRNDRSADRVYGAGNLN